MRLTAIASLLGLAIAPSLPYPYNILTTLVVCGVLFSCLIYIIVFELILRRF